MGTILGSDIGATKIGGIAIEHNKTEITSAPFLKKSNIDDLFILRWQVAALLRAYVRAWVSHVHII